MTQRYTHPVAVGWMETGGCPECGGKPEEHTGGGGPWGCTLTDNGAAQRIAAYQADQAKEGS